MRKILYSGLFLIANTLLAAEVDKLQIHDEPIAPISAAYETLDGKEEKLGESESALRVVNFWALWCPPCRKEMPLLDALDEAYDDAELDVITIAVGPNDPDKVKAFFDELEINNLPVYFDKRQRLAKAAGVVGLPHTIIINQKGEELARIIGEADYRDEALIEKIVNLSKN